ncbi:MAG: ABC transporter substrate-binding protein, partial [Hyphomicrobiaceae bacterium]
MSHRTKLFVAALLATTMAAGLAEARTVKWARSGDSLTLDPHAQNEGPTHNLSHHIYEPLIIRDTQGKPLPALAESWAITSDPTVWEFKLRKGVKFHDGAPFAADDVVFSYQRALQPTSDMKALLGSV